jgi:hypothetical protein
MEIVNLKPVLTASKYVYKVGRLIWSGITRWYLEPIYQRSHDAYFDRRRLGSIWYPLGDLLEVSIETTDRFTKRCGRAPGLALRTKSSVPHPVEKATLLVRTQGIEGAHQEPVYAYRIGHEPEIIRLNNMPSADVLVIEENLVLTVKRITIELLEICYQGETHVPWSRTSINFSPTYYDQLNDTWVEKWGRLYNLDQYLNAHIEWVHAVGAALFHFHENLSPLQGRFTLWGLIREAIARLLTSHFIFALLVITQRVKITDDGRISNNMKWISVKKVQKWLGISRERHYYV